MSAYTVRTGQTSVRRSRVRVYAEKSVTFARDHTGHPIRRVVLFYVRALCFCTVERSEGSRAPTRSSQGSARQVFEIIVLVTRNDYVSFDRKVTVFISIVDNGRLRGERSKSCTLADRIEINGPRFFAYVVAVAFGRRGAMGNDKFDFRLSRTVIITTV